MPDRQIKPTESLERIYSLDFLRGVAILGILFINAENFAYPDSWSPWKFGFESSKDHSTRFWVYFLTQGKFYTMFALLFGVGFYVFLERLELKRLGLISMDIYARRLLWLFVFGMAHAYLVWSGDVLYHYAICGFLLFPFRSMKTQNLIWIICFLALMLMIKSYDQTTKRQNWLNEYTEACRVPENERTTEDIKKVEFWKDKTAVKNALEARYVEVPKQTYIKGLQETFEHANTHKGVIYYSGLLFPSLICMILGIIFYRSGVFRDYHVWKHYWVISFTILLVGLVINYQRYYHWTYEYYKPVVNVWKGWLFTFPKETLGVGYILILNGFYQKFLGRFQLKIISLIGRITLSNYIFQNVLLGFIFYGYGLAKFNQFSRFDLLGIVFVIWMIQAVVSWLWLYKYKQGPLEYIWKTLTYNSFKGFKS